MFPRASSLTGHRGLSAWIRHQWNSPRVKLARLLPRVSLSLAVVVVCTGLISAGLGPAATLARGFLVGSIPPTLSGGGLSSEPGRTTVFALAVVSALFVLQLIIRSLSGGFVESLSLLVDQHLEERTIKALGTPHGLSHLEGPDIANKLSVLQGVGSGGYRPGSAVGGLTTRVQTWLSGLGSAVILAGFRWWVAVALSAVYLWAARVTLRDYMVLMKLSSGQAPTIRRSHYYRDLAFIPAAAKEVRVFGLGDWLINSFKEFWYEAMQPLWQERSNRRELAVASLVMSVSSIAAAAYVGISAINGEFGIGEVTVFLGAISGLYSFGSGYGPGDIQLQYGLSALSAIDDIERAGEMARPAGHTALPSEAPIEGIRFDGISFSYPGTTKPILQDLSLEIPAHKSTAIVGVNGAGKTTVVKLLCRFYDPQRGGIFVDGVDLSELDPGLWQRQIAAVFQDFVRYELTALDNIALGAPETAEQQDLIWKATERARAKELVEGLPKGLDTVLSREVTDGVQISGGEWQRLVLARALFAAEAGAKVLILDEPTAALDVRAEAEIYRSFLDVTRGLTTVLISHRFSTVRLADVIHVIEQGHVIETGTHEELLELGGRYARMFNLQASRFTDEEVPG